MTPFEYALNIGLVGLVLLQLRGRKLTVVNLLVPVAITVFVAMNFLHAIPTTGNDMVLELGGALLGALLGTAAALTTRIDRDNLGRAIAKAGVVAAILWVVGIGARVGFSLYVQHGGYDAVGRFSMTHAITGQAWGVTFTLMAVAEVLSRTGIVFLKARRSGALIERGGLLHSALAS